MLYWNMVKITERGEHKDRGESIEQGGTCIFNANVGKVLE